MCGIFGSLSTGKGLENIPDTAERLCAALAHRGPDDSGWAAFSPDGCLVGSEGGHAALGETSCSLLLGQTRLAIIDLSAAGHQPMVSPDGRFSLVFNGEIYNYLELRRELEREGAVFRSLTDTEVLLQALIQWGESCLPRLTGMFAFTFFDAAKKELLCARDPFGIKPFYYSAGKGFFSFASELPALLQLPGVPRKLDWTVAYNFFLVAREGVGPETMLRGVRQLAPAHLLRVSTMTGVVSSQERWWEIPLTKAKNISFDDAARELRQCFLDSVRVHLRSDVPLGVALSGGVDSSAIVCAVRHLQPDSELHAFSYVASDALELSEARWIDIASKAAGALVQTTSPTTDEVLRDLDQLIVSLGEPFSSMGLYAQYRVNKLAADNGIKVLLNGEGGDEALGGYYGYPAERILSLLGKGQLIAALRHFKTVSGLAGCDGKHVLLRILKLLLPSGLESMGRKFARRNPAPDWLRMHAVTARGAARFLSSDGGIYANPDKLRERLANSLTWAGLPNLLRYGDRCAMAVCIENRVPFLTPALAGHTLSLPEEYLVDTHGVTKAVFRKAMRGIVPDPLLDRKDKIGFESPDWQWLKALASWVRETLCEDSGHADGILDKRAVQNFWDATYAGERAYEGALWRILCFMRWRTLLNITE